MLGYVRIYKPDMKVREYELYCGYYCGICKYIGKEYGQFPRMALSYDAAFLAVLLDSVIADPDRPSREHCIVHHINKRTVVRNESIAFAGDLMLILAWFKLLDDAHDDGKTSAKAAALLLRPIYRKLEKKYPDFCKGIATHLSELSALEETHCASLDAAAEAFAKIMEVIFREGASCLHETFAEIGYHLGKWIYLIDALDDIEENIENKTYNPLLYRFDYRGMVSGSSERADETADEFRSRIRDRASFNLFHYLAIISEKIESLDIKKNKGIIENVVYFGMNNKTREILEHKETKKENPNESI